MSTVDFFISHAGSDRPWAQWAAYHLEAAGFTVSLDANDWSSGDDFMQRMEEAIEHSNRMIALFSRAYFKGTFSMMELRSWLTRPDGDRSLAVFRVEDVTPPTFYRRLMSVDLFGHTPQARVSYLLNALAPRGSAVSEPQLPAEEEDSGVLALRASLPPVWNVAPRNPAFIGRDSVLANLRQRLEANEHAVVHAIEGIGGVGKTQLAIEYCHRFASEYELVWWIDAQKVDRISEQLAALATVVGVAPADSSVPEAVKAVKAYLHQHPRWILIFDNAESAASLAPWLPDRVGHVLITSRNPDWQGVAEAVDIEVFTLEESVEFLCTNVAGISPEVAADLATRLGFLPLALAQAAGLLSVSSTMKAEDYLALIQNHASQMMSLGADGSHASFAATLTLSMRQLGELNPAALDLLRICSLLAPEPIPLDLFQNSPVGTLPPALAASTAEPAGLRPCQEVLLRMGLARVTDNGLVLHRLTQTVVADSMSGPARAAAHNCASALVANAHPDDGTYPRNWPRWQQLMPHLLALSPGMSDNPRLRAMANDSVIYLVNRGDLSAARATATTLHEDMMSSLGATHRDALQSAQNLANCLFELGDIDSARILDEKTLAQRHDVFGPDDPDTLESASDLALDLHRLGEFERARELNEHTFAARTKLLGDDHPQTLTSANNLAQNLRALGEYAGAKRLDEHTLQIWTQERGEEHLTTLISASNLAVDLFHLRDYAKARDLYEHIFHTRLTVLGAEHPDTKSSALGLARTMRALGQHDQARELEARFSPS